MTDETVCQNGLRGEACRPIVFNAGVIITPKTGVFNAGVRKGFAGLLLQDLLHSGEMEPCRAILSTKFEQFGRRPTAAPRDDLRGGR